jgi:hypothetical protein
MSEKFRQGMAVFDDYNSACEGLFKELDVSLVAGSMEVAALPSCPDLYQLMESGLLRGSLVSTPSKPIAEPFGVPESPSNCQGPDDGHNVPDGNREKTNN